MESKSFFEKAYNPILQAGTVFGIALGVSLVAKVVKLSGIITVSDLFPWKTSASFLLLFSVFNSVFSLTTKDMTKYWGRSIYSFLGLAFATGLMAYAFSLIPLNEAGSYRWIYLVVTIGYLVFLSLMTLMRQIVDFAQREEWHQPRFRNKR